MRGLIAGDPSGASLGEICTFVINDLIFFLFTALKNLLKAVYCYLCPCYRNFPACNCNRVFFRVFTQFPTKVGPQTYDIEHLCDFSCLTFIYFCGNFALERR